MPAHLSISLHNDMHHICWFTVVDNVSGKTVLDDNMDEDEIKKVQIASDSEGEGDISYTVRDGITIRKMEINDGDTVDMN